MSGTGLENPPQIDRPACLALLVQPCDRLCQFGVKRPRSRLLACAFLMTPSPMKDRGKRRPLMKVSTAR
jgi:hypothetical protein